MIRLTWGIHYPSPLCVTSLSPLSQLINTVNHRSSQIKHFRYHRNVTIETVKYHLVLFNYYSASQVSTWQRIPFILGWIWFVNTFRTGRKTFLLSWFKLVAQGFGTNAHIQRLLHKPHAWNVPQGNNATYFYVNLESNVIEHCDSFLCAATLKEDPKFGKIAWCPSSSLQWTQGELMTVSWRQKATELTNQHWLKCSLNDTIGQRSGFPLPPHRQQVLHWICCCCLVVMVIVVVVVVFMVRMLYFLPAFLVVVTVTMTEHLIGLLGADVLFCPSMLLSDMWYVTLFQFLRQ